MYVFLLIFVKQTEEVIARFYNYGRSSKPTSKTSIPFHQKCNKDNWDYPNQRRIQYPEKHFVEIVNSFTSFSF